MDYPVQESSRTVHPTGTPSAGFDMREWLHPRRMTMIMWDNAFLMRHMKGDAFEDYDRVLDEAMERGYNTLRIDPMPQLIDLAEPDKVFSRPANGSQPFNPWDRTKAVEGPLGAWLIEFMEKVQDRGLDYCLSAWCGDFPNGTRIGSLQDITECWSTFLREWRKRFGFDRCVYVDLSNEFPHFLGGYQGEVDRDHGGRWSRDWKAWIAQDVNGCLRRLREENPEVRFMVSLHGDPRWIDVDLELDVMDIHFYADADRRFCDRTRFDVTCGEMFRGDELYKDFSERCRKSHSIMAPMYRARQRSKLAAFAAWSQSSGIPLLTTESWASWYYIDHKDMDWTWLLEWAEWSVEDALEFGMWGWTPHNYCQPQFENWKDARWHRRLTDRFLRG